MISCSHRSPKTTYLQVKKPSTTHRIYDSEWVNKILTLTISTFQADSQCLYLCVSFENHEPDGSLTQTKRLLL